MAHSLIGCRVIHQNKPLNMLTVLLKHYFSFSWAFLFLYVRRKMTVISVAIRRQRLNNCSNYARHLLIPLNVINGLSDRITSRQSKSNLGFSV